MTQYRVIDLPAGRIRLREHGERTATPVVFVHGLLVDDTAWGEVPQRLAERGFRTLVPTWPLGAHRTQFPRLHDWSLTSLSELVRSFVAELSLDEVVLVGSDTGGALCQAVVTSDASHLAGLVLTNCDAFEVFPPPPFDRQLRVFRHPLLGRLMMQAMRVPRLRNGRRGFGGLATSRLDRLTPGWVAPYLNEVQVRRDLAAYAQAWHPDSLTRVSPQLRTTSIPALISWGAVDDIFPLSLAHRLHETLSRSRLVEIRGAATLVALDAPDRLTDEIHRFGVDHGLLPIR